MNTETIKSMMRSLKPGDSFHINGDEQVLTEIATEFGANIKNVELDIFKISIPKQSGPSKMKRIHEVLENYQRGESIVDFDLAYVRQIVSKWNSEHNDSFKVKTVVENNEVMPTVYKDVENYKVITQKEYDEIESDFMQRLRSLILKIESTTDHDTFDGPEWTVADDNSDEIDDSELI